MKIYTKTGDDGTTGLFNGQRVDKYSPRVNAYGTIDELNSVIGLAISSLADSILKNDLVKISHLLFELGSDLATPYDPPPKFEVKRLNSESTIFLENSIDFYTEKLEKLTNFILPGGTTAASFLHLARTVCRRAERYIVELSRDEIIGETVIIFVNRLSDYLFTAARFANQLEGVDDIIWDGK